MNKTSILLKFLFVLVVLGIGYIILFRGPVVEQDVEIENAYDPFDETNFIEPMSVGLDNYQTEIAAALENCLILREPEEGSRSEKEVVSNSCAPMVFEREVTPGVILITEIDKPKAEVGQIIFYGAGDIGTLYYTDVIEYHLKLQFPDILKELPDGTTELSFQDKNNILINTPDCGADGCWPIYIFFNGQRWQGPWSSNDHRLFFGCSGTYRLSKDYIVFDEGGSHTYCEADVLYYLRVRSLERYHQIFLDKENFEIVKIEYVPLSEDEKYTELWPGINKTPENIATINTFYKWLEKNTIKDLFYKMSSWTNGEVLTNNEVYSGAHIYPQGWNYRVLNSLNNEGYTNSATGTLFFKDLSQGAIMIGTGELEEPEKTLLKECKSEYIRGFLEFGSDVSMYICNGSLDLDLLQTAYSYLILHREFYID